MLEDRVTPIRMADDHDSRTFDDRRGTSKDPALHTQWILNMENGICIPPRVIQDAENHSKEDVIDLLQYVENWLSEMNNSNGSYHLPVDGWEERLRKYYTGIPESVRRNARESYPNDEFLEWKHIVLHLLKEAISGLKSANDENSKTVEGVASEGSVGENTQLDEDSTPEAIHLSNIDPLTPPLNLKDTHEISEILKKRETFHVMQLFGGVLTGKTFAMLRHLEMLAKDFKQKCVSSIVWKVDCKQGTSSVKSEFVKLAQKMEDKEMISSQEYKSLDSINPNGDEFVVNLIKLIQEKRIATVFTFDDVMLNETDKGLIRQIMETVIRFDKLNNNSIRVIAITRGQDDIYNRNDITNQDTFFQYQVSGYTDKEAIEYLKNPTEVIYYRYIEDDHHQSKRMFTKEGAEKLASYFNNNPGCLKAAKIYCLTRNISYEKYLESMKSDTNRQFIQERVVEILQNDNEKDAKAYQALHKLHSPANDLNSDARKMDKILRVLCFVCPQDIPIFYIGKVCEYLRSTDDELSVDDIENLNSNEASDAVYRLQENGSLLNKAHINYPNGVVDIQNSVSDSLRLQTHEETDKHVLIASKAMVRMTSKDNTTRKADERLSQLRPHILALAPKAAAYLKRNFNASEKSKDNFIVAMSICRLYEILGQASIQGRLDDTWEKALNILLQSASLVWEVVGAYCSAQPRFLCFNSAVLTDDDLKYTEGKDPEEEAKKISKKCIKAGKKVSTELLDEYFQSSFVFNQNNVEEFVANTMETLGISEREARNKLQVIQVLVDKKRPCSKDNMQLLRETTNLLKAKELQDTFFSERLSSIFHTYGRQVHYFQNKMPLAMQKECEYYTQLSHHLAKATRVKAELDVGLFNEFIAINNATIPRLLQNRKGETAQSKLEALSKAYELAQNSLEDTRKYYESGCYRRTKGSSYTELNVYKYLVKANTKKLKYSTKDALPNDAWDVCATMLQMANHNSKLGMAPHCMIQAAKFYAATGCFKEAFDAFGVGFHTPGGDNQTATGMIHLRDWRPNSLAWAVNNLCMTVEASSQLQTSQEKQKKAIEYCKLVCSFDRVSKQWKETMEEWLNKFETL